MTKLRRYKTTTGTATSARRYLLQGGLFLSLVLVVFAVTYFAMPALLATRYESGAVSVAVATTTPEKKGFVATHVPTPKQVKAIYMTSWVAGSKELRSKLVNIIDTTEINSVVIDIKDDTGRISFQVDDPYLKEIGSVENRIPDAREFIADLHKRGIYVIGRISTFQDPYFVKLKPEFAVKRESDGGVWKDRKGISWLDAGSEGVWRYLVTIGKQAYDIGFDELNYDYIRFPSDGNMKDIAYPASGNQKKPVILQKFFAYLSENIKPTGAVLSADLFGMTSTNEDDLGIGQVLEVALPYFDYIAPMVYPSHYPPTFLGFANPATKPYEVIKFSMDRAVARTVATSTFAVIPGVSPIASTTPAKYPKDSFPATKIRPWLQDFNLGATYTADMVRAQIQATYDSGLTSWMLWNAANRYTVEALHAEPLASDFR